MFSASTHRPLLSDHLSNTFHHVYSIPSTLSPLQPRPPSYKHPIRTCTAGCHNSSNPHRSGYPQHANLQSEPDTASHLPVRARFRCSCGRVRNGVVSGCTTGVLGQMALCDINTRRKFRVVPYVLESSSMVSSLCQVVRQAVATGPGLFVQSSGAQLRVRMSICDTTYQQ